MHNGQQEGKNMNPEIGKSYKAKPYFTSLASAAGGVAGGTANTRKAMYGKCVFAHPEGRFVTLEFQFRFGAIRESFRLEELL